MLITVIITGNFCFGQPGDLHFIIDTIAAKNDDYINEYDYYNDKIIRCKTFYRAAIYDYSMRPVHFEFIWLEDTKFYCIEYDDHGNKMNEGTVKKESVPYDSLVVPIFDSSGKKIIDNKKVSDYYKFCKDEFWKEGMSGDYSFDRSFEYGRYNNGKRDSTWRIVKVSDVQKEIFYDKGVMLKEKVVNLTATGDEKIRTILQQRWKQITITSIPDKFVPDPNNEDNFCTMELNKDGTFVWNMYCNTLVKGKWQLNKEKTVVTFSSQMEKTSYKIDYISSYGLSLSRQF